MSCVLRAGGARFDVDEFLKNSTLDVLTAFHRGEVQFATSSVTRKTEYSGISVSVSTREFSDLRGQIEEAIAFLTENDGELRRLRDFSGLEWMDLDFPIEDRDVVYQRDAFPHHLLSLLGSLRTGLIISRHPVPAVAEVPEVMQ
ncbi:MAG TPA: hypothetical protein VMF10_00165 [Candidatus Aquilonibacter sp.]|nr:hypothetical protein [Candidatus Aquilonibacter sp.]